VKETSGTHFFEAQAECVPDFAIYMRSVWCPQTVARAAIALPLIADSVTREGELCCYREIRTADVTIGYRRHAKRPAVSSGLPNVNCLLRRSRARDSLVRSFPSRARLSALRAIGTGIMHRIPGIPTVCAQAHACNKMIGVGN